MKTTILIFGASGDLARRKLLPALFGLFQQKRLPPEFNIACVSRTPYSHIEFRKLVWEGIQQYKPLLDDKLWTDFSERIFYISADADHLDDYAKIKQELASLEGGPANRLYYLSVSPVLYERIILNLGNADMAIETDAWRRIIIEKPFGINLHTARQLNETTHTVFAENQIYRIDHYLGKETAQNILFLRFANSIFEPVWNHNYIDNVQITVAETVDVGSRAPYYDTAGVLRDMFQNHLLQLLMFTTMEPPSSFDADKLRNEKVKVLESIRPPDNMDFVIGQYEGYRSEKGVNPASRTPTYAALRLNIDNWRWKGVPFYLRSGKALKDKISKILIEFKSPPHMLFNLHEGDKFARNILSLCIQPDEGIHLQFEAKIPGTSQAFRSVDMEFHYADAFQEKISDAYERLILDAIQGDPSLFTRHDEIEAAWKLFDPIITHIESENSILPAQYTRGTWGPHESDTFLEQDGRQWRRSGCLHESDQI